jgi:hypothetical protein
MRGETRRTTGITETRRTGRTRGTRGTRGTPIRRGERSFVILNEAGLVVDRFPFNRETPNDESNEERKEDETKLSSKKKLSPIPEDGSTSESNHSISKPSISKPSTPKPSTPKPIDKNITSYNELPENIVVFEPKKRVVILNKLPIFEKNKKDILINYPALERYFNNDKNVSIVGSVISSGIIEKKQDKRLIEYTIKIYGILSIDLPPRERVKKINDEKFLIEHPFKVYYDENGSMYDKDGKLYEGTEIEYLGKYIRSKTKRSNQTDTKSKKSKESKKGGKNKTKKHRR